MLKGIYRSPFIYIGLILSSCFIYIPQLIDYTLHSRFLFLSISLLVVIGFNLYAKQKSSLKVDWLIFIYVAFVAFNFISIFWAINKAEAIFDSFKLVLGLMVFFISFNFLTLNHEKYVQLLTKGIIILASVNLIISTIIIFKIDQINLEQVNHKFLGFCGSKNSFTTFLYLFIPFIFYGVVTFSQKWKKFSAITLFGILWLIIVLQTRSVWLCICINGALFLLYYLIKHRSNKVFISLKALSGFSSLLIFLVLVTFFLKSHPAELVNRFRSVFEFNINISEVKSITTSNNSRIFLWQKSLLMTRDNPILGVGAGNWQINFPNYSVTNLTAAEFGYINFNNPHNDYLWILSENGLLGFLMILIFVLTLLILFIRKIYNEEDAKERFIMYIFLIVFIGHLIISFFDFPKQRIEHIVILNIILSILYFKILQSNKKVYFQISNFKLNIGLILIMSVCTAVGVFRFKGELFTSKMYQARVQRNWSKIIEYCDKSSSYLYNIDPGGMPIRWFRGTANTSLKDYQNAYTDFLISYKFSPYNKNVINDLGSINYKLGNKQKAIDYYIEALRISANFDEPKLNLAAIYFNDGNYTKALELVNSTSKNNNTIRKKQMLMMLNEKVKK